MSAPTALDILLRARELPWCQNYMALDDSGREVDIEDRRAARFCVLGAVERAAMVRKTYHRDAKLIAEHFLELALAGSQFLRSRASIVLFNDAPGRTEAEVRAVEDSAIELAKAAIETEAGV